MKLVQVSFLVGVLASLVACTYTVSSELSVTNRTNQPLKLVVSKCQSDEIVMDEIIQPYKPLTYDDYEECINLVANKVDGGVYAKMSEVSLPPSFNWTIK